jgi:hypothetical protein
VLLTCFVACAAETASGPDAAAVHEHGDAARPEPADGSTAPPVQDADGSGACAQISAACSLAPVVDAGPHAVSALCTQVAEGGNAEECEALRDECTGCGSDEEPVAVGEDAASQCEELGTRCHDRDTGSGLGHLCHEVGHVVALPWCVLIYDECAALCFE